MPTNNINSYLTVYKTLYHNKKYTYMSCPITTGHVFIDWYNKEGRNLDRDSEEYKKSHYENVILENKRIATSEVKRIYKLFEAQRILKLIDGDIIINPAEFDAPFSQAEYILFWTEFISKYVSRIVFIPGWLYSHGALAEYITAINNKIPAFDHLLAPLTKEKALRSLDVAIDFLQALDMKTGLQENIIKLLKNE